MIDAFPEQTVWEFYGSTEGQFTACRAEEWLERPGTVVRARRGRALSVDADRTIWCSVPRYARFTYWRDPAKSAAAWRGDAFTVGDLGRLDQDGYLYLDGRREDLVISGGVNVYPAEVEDVIYQLPGVGEAAVIGVPDERWGEVGRAVVVRRPGHELTEEEIVRHCSERLARFKVPRSVVFVDALPRNATGKVLKRELRAGEGALTP